MKQERTFLNVTIFNNYNTAYLQVLHLYDGLESNDRFAGKKIKKTI